MLVHEILKRGKDNNDAIYSQLGALTYQGLRVATENCRRRLYAMGVRQRSTVGIYRGIHGDSVPWRNSRAYQLPAQYA